MVYSLLFPGLNMESGYVKENTKIFSGHRPPVVYTASPLNVYM